MSWGQKSDFFVQLLLQSYYSEQKEKFVSVSVIEVFEAQANAKEKAQHRVKIGGIAAATVTGVGAVKVLILGATGLNATASTGLVGLVVTPIFGSVPLFAPLGGVLLLLTIAVVAVGIFLYKKHGEEIDRLEQSLVTIRACIGVHNNPARELANGFIQFQESDSHNQEHETQQIARALHIQNFLHHNEPEDVIGICVENVKTVLQELVDYLHVTYERRERIERLMGEQERRLATLIDSENFLVLHECLSDESTREFINYVLDAEDSAHEEGDAGRMFLDILLNIDASNQEDFENALQRSVENIATTLQLLADCQNVSDERRRRVEQLIDEQGGRLTTLTGSENFPVLYEFLSNENTKAFIKYFLGAEDSDYQEGDVARMLLNAWRRVGVLDQEDLQAALQRSVENIRTTVQLLAGCYNVSADCRQRVEQLMREQEGHLATLIGSENFLVLRECLSDESTREFINYVLDAEDSDYEEGDARRMFWNILLSLDVLDQKDLQAALQRSVENIRTTVQLLTGCHNVSAERQRRFADFIPEEGALIFQGGLPEGFQEVYELRSDENAQQLFNYVLETEEKSYSKGHVNELLRNAVQSIFWRGKKVAVAYSEKIAMALCVLALAREDTYSERVGDLLIDFF